MPSFGPFDKVFMRIWVQEGSNIVDFNDICGRKGAGFWPNQAGFDGWGRKVLVFGQIYLIC